MPRPLRSAPGGFVYHVINRGNGRADVFHSAEDFAAFERVLSLACERFNMRILAWVLMNNHFHLVLWPRRDGDLQAFMQWVTTCHVRRYHKHYKGSGHVWQGRYRSFAVERGGHLLSVLRYVERNPVRAGMVKKAQDWRYSSASNGVWLRSNGVWLRSEAKVPDPIAASAEPASIAKVPDPIAASAEPASIAKVPDPIAASNVPASNRVWLRSEAKVPDPIAADAEPVRIAGDGHSEPGLMGSGTSASLRSQTPLGAWLVQGPTPRPEPWLRYVNREEEAELLARLREAVNRGSPFGSDTWRENAAKKLGLESTIRPRGRPKKAEK